jgi:uncharacterized protein (DUF983 family)
MPAKPRFWPVVARGARRRCPHCGEGPLFKGWFTMFDACPVCRLVYERNHGDTWFFWILSDRIPIGAGIVLLYFGFRATTWLSAAIFLLAMVVPLIWSMPYRKGIAIALAYLSRVYLPDPSDELPRTWTASRPASPPPRSAPTDPAASRSD